MKRKFLHDISFNSLQVIINQACGLAIFYVLSVYFSKNDFGEINWSLAVLLTTFGILSFGIDQVIVKKIAAGEDPKLMLSVYFLHVLLTGTLFYGFLLIVHLFHGGFLHNHQLLLFLGIGKLMIFFSSPFKQLANGLEKFRALFYMSVCSNVVRGSALILFAFFLKLDLTLVIIIFIAGDFAELLLSAFVTKKLIRVQLKFEYNKKLYLNLLKESLPQAGVVIFTSGIARFDWILLGLLASNVVLAEYSFAFKVFEVAMIPLLIIAPILIPRFTRLFYLNKREPDAKKMNHFFDLFRFEIIIASFSSLMLNILWVPVIDTITHGKYGLVNHYNILILSACMPFIYANNFLWTINFVKGKLKMIFYIFFITFLINVTGNIALIPFFAAKGAAVAYLVAMISQFVLFWLETDISLIKKNRLLILPPVAAIVSGYLSRATFDNIWLILNCSICIFFFILLYCKLLGRSDWLMLKRIIGF